MFVRPERINAVFDVAKTIFSEDAWEVAVSRSHISFSHKSCTWAGRLVKLHMRNCYINGPQKARDMLVRPEARVCDIEDGLRVTWKETLEPGDAIVEEHSTLLVDRFTACLFGNFSGPKKNSCFCFPKPMPTRHQLRRDFPEAGDCSYAAFQEEEGIGQEHVTVVRNTEEPQHFDIAVVFTLPEDKWPTWASHFFVSLTEVYYSSMVWFLNRPFFNALRVLDQEIYVVLGLRNYNRGPPLLPVKEGKAEVAISVAGKRFSEWCHFSTGKFNKFHLADYMMQLLAALGYDIPAYETMDGQRLVPYQCVLLRSAWLVVRAELREAMKLQRSAYRRANGGSGAPSLIEDTWPRFTSPCTACTMPEDSKDSEDWRVEVVVRKTFLELDEGTSDLMRKTKSGTAKVYDTCHDNQNS